MQRCQDQLDFNIETPSDTELAKRFAKRQQFLAGRVDELSTYHQQQNQMKTKKNLEEDEPCQGFEISPGTGLYSGCDQTCGDCPICGK